MTDNLYKSFPVRVWCIYSPLTNDYLLTESGEVIRFNDKDAANIALEKLKIPKAVCVQVWLP
mgnify:CR=1 FL=1